MGDGNTDGPGDLLRMQVRGPGVQAVVNLLIELRLLNDGRDSGLRVVKYPTC